MLTLIVTESYPSAVALLVSFSLSDQSLFFLSPNSYMSLQICIYVWFQAASLFLLSLLQKASMGKHVSTTILIMQYADSDLTLSLSTSASISPSVIRLILCTPHVTKAAVVLQVDKMRFHSLKSGDTIQNISKEKWNRASYEINSVT